MKAEARSGIILLDKPAGITSQTAVNAVRRAFGTKQAGHTGTLDPLATGLLVVLVGRAVKASEYATCDRKRYEAVMKLGTETDTEDITGEVISEKRFDLSDGDIIAACESFTGEYLQTPPMYSAVKVGGRKLYEIARAGGSVERAARPVVIYSLSAKRFSDDSFSLSVECSSGTYIRTLCADIGRKLGCGACMSALRRTAVGDFTLDAAVTPDGLAAAAEAGTVGDLLIPVERLFSGLGEIRLSPFYEKLMRNGCEIYLSKLRSPGGVLPDCPSGTRLKIFSSTGNFFALGEVGDWPEGKAVKALKLLAL